MYTFSLMATGRLLNATPLQKLSTRLATNPSLYSRTFSPCTLWNLNGGRLGLMAPVPDFGAVNEKSKTVIETTINNTVR